MNMIRLRQTQWTQRELDPFKVSPHEYYVYQLDFISRFETKFAFCLFLIYDDVIQTRECLRSEQPTPADEDWALRLIAWPESCCVKSSSHTI